MYKLQSYIKLESKYKEEAKMSINFDHLVISLTLQFKVLFGINSFSENFQVEYSNVDLTEDPLHFSLR